MQTLYVGRGIIRPEGVDDIMLELTRTDGDNWEITVESKGVRKTRCTGTNWQDGKLIFETLQSKIGGL